MKIATTNDLQNFLVHTYSTSFNSGVLLLLCCVGLILTCILEFFMRTIHQNGEVYSIANEYLGSK